MTGCVALQRSRDARHRRGAAGEERAPAGRVRHLAAVRGGLQPGPGAPRARPGPEVPAGAHAQQREGRERHTCFQKEKETKVRLLNLLLSYRKRSKWIT